MPAETRRVIVISDAGYHSDDANALCMLLGAEGLRVEGVVATSGNVWNEEAYAEIRRLLKAIGREDVAVYAGPRSQSHEERRRYYLEREAAAVGYAGALARPPSAGKVTAAPPLDALWNLARREQGAIDLLVLGPATAFADLARAEPDCRRWFRRTFVMGGAFAVAGNASARAEFNFWFDPEAANVLVRSQPALTLVPLDAVQDVHFSQQTLDALREPATPGARHVRESVERRGKKSSKPVPMWDEVLVAAYLHEPAVSAYELGSVHVVTQRGADYGASRLEPRAEAGTVADTRVVMRVDEALLNELARALLA